MICLSFDTDHMNEDRMQEFLQAISFPGEGTFFCTQYYACLNESAHEIAPHPYLGEESDWQQELKHMRELFPEATGWRAHSCVFSHLLAEWAGRNGYQYLSTHDQFGATGIQATQHSWGVWHLPIYYMDNMDFSRHKFWGDQAPAPFAKKLITQAVTDDGLYVFDFHPIHLLLNTPDPSYYFDMRDRFLQGEAIAKLRYEGYGTANFFAELCEAMVAKGLKSHRMQEVLTTLIQERR